MTKRTLIGERGYQDCERLQGEPSWQCEHIVVNVMIYVYYLYDSYLNLLFKPSTKWLDNPILNITVVVRIQLDISTKTGLLIYGPIVLFCFLFFSAFDFCRFCVVIRVFHPRHNGQWPPTSKDFLSQILSITFIFLS